MKRGALLGIVVLFMVLAVSWTVMGVDNTSTQTDKSVEMGFQNTESQVQPKTDEAERIGYIMVNGEDDSLPVIEGTVYRENHTMTGIVTMGNFNVKISENLD